MKSHSSASVDAFAAAAVTIILWAGSFPAIAIGIRHVDAVGLASVRFAVAAAVMGIWLGWRGEALRTRVDVARAIACGLVGIALYNVLLNTGQRTVSPGAASFIIGIQPVFAAGFACLLGTEAFTWPALVGTLISLLGVGVISLGQSSELNLGSGVALILAAAACSGGYFVMQRPLVVRYGAMSSASWTIVFGALLLTPWLPSGLEQVATSREAMLSAAFLAVGAGVIGYACWMRALAGLGAARAANLLFLMAPLATVLSIPVTGHIPELSTVFGGAAALAGVAIVNHSYRRREPAAAPEH